MKNIYLDVLENTTKVQGKDLLVEPANRCNLNHTHPILRFFGPTACDGNLTKTSDKFSRKRTATTKTDAWRRRVALVSFLSFCSQPSGHKTFTNHLEFSSRKKLKKIPWTVIANGLRFKDSFPLKLSWVANKKTQKWHSIFHPGRVFFRNSKSNVQEGYNTPLEHTPGHQASQLWKDSLYGLLLKV